MPDQSCAAEVDLVGQGPGGNRRHAELAEELKPLRVGEQRPKGYLREDPVECPLMSVNKTATVLPLRAAPSRNSWKAIAGRSVPPLGTAPNWAP